MNQFRASGGKCETIPSAATQRFLAVQMVDRVLHFRRAIACAHINRPKVTTGSFRTNHILRGISGGSFMVTFAFVG